MNNMAPVWDPSALGIPRLMATGHTVAGEAPTERGHGDEVADERLGRHHPVERRPAGVEQRLHYLVYVVLEVALEVETDVVVLDHDVCGSRGNRTASTRAASPSRPMRADRGMCSATNTSGK